MRKFTFLLILLTGAFAFAQSPTDNATDPPARDGADVISIFSGEYTNVAGTDFNPNWGQAGFATANTAFDPGTGNLVLGYPNFNYQGNQFGSPQNIAAMEFLHVDIWINGTFNPNVFVISSGGEIAHPITNTGSGTWISVDIPVAGITNDTSNAIQFKFDGGNGSTDAVYVDNLYFWKTPADPAEDATLSDLQVAGATIPGFSPATTSYIYELTVGTTTPPMITSATPTQGGANAVINQATTVPGDATVEVTASNGTDMEIYTVSFVATLPNASPTPTTPDGEVLALLADISDTGGFTNYWNPSYYFGSNIGTPDLDPSGAVNKSVKMDFSIAGWGGGINNGSDVYTDVSAYGYLNFSYFAVDEPAGVNGAEFKFILIGGGASPGGTGAGEYGYVLKDAGNGGDGDIVYGSWQNVSVPLSFFVNNGWSTDNYFQFKLGSTSDLNSKVVYFDNMYFSVNPGTVLGLQEFEQIAMSVYPNPTQYVWNIKTNNLNIDSIQVIDIQGRQVFDIKPNTNEAIIDASSLPAGLYFARINTQAGTNSIKLIKQ